jgi:hypothetical protein
LIVGLLRTLWQPHRVLHLDKYENICIIVSLGEYMTRTINPHVFLEAIRNNDKYRNNLIQIAPSLKEDISSFVENPNCGCKGRIHKYMVDNINQPQIVSFLNYMQREFKNVVSENTSNPGDTSTVSVQAVNIKPMSGHVVEIPAIPSEYLNLISAAKAENWEYDGVSVMERKNMDGETVWLVFFY